MPWLHSQVSKQPQSIKERICSKKGKTKNPIRINHLTHMQLKPNMTIPSVAYPKTPESHFVN